MTTISPYPTKKQSLQQGFILLPVVLTLTILAALAFMLSRQGAINSGGVVREMQSETARYIAKAGLNHALWKANQANCTGYTNYTSIPLGPHNFSSTITPSSGSPVNIKVAAAHADGANYSIQRNRTKVYQIPSTLVLQPDAASGKEAYLYYPGTTNNYGSTGETWISTMSNDKTVALYEFDLGAVPPGVTILSATLSLHHWQGWDSNVPISAHRITNAWNESEVSWDNRTSTQAWNTPAGDFDPQVINTTLVGPASNIRYEWHLKSVVQKWVDGSLPNYGVLLRTTAPNIDGERFYTSDEADSSRHPRLTISYACECGQVCGAPVATFCEADYTPNKIQNEYSSSKIGAADVQAITYLPEAVVFNGVASPAGGAWILIDAVDSQFYMTDMAGSLLASMKMPVSAHGGVFISSGTFANTVALTNTSGGLFYVDISDGSAVAVPDSGSSQAAGIGFVETSSSGTYDDHILILDRASKTVLIRTQAGAAVSSFSVNDGSFFPVQDINHLPGSDKVIVTYDPGKSIIYDFDGNKIREYDITGFGVTLAESTAINPLTCEHVVADRGSDRVVTLNYADTLPLAHWRLDETTGTIAVDSVGGHDGSLMAGPVWQTTGKIDGALFFDGVDDRIVVPHNSMLAMTTKITISAWINMSSLTSAGRIISKEQDNQNDAYWMGTSATSLWLGIGGTFISPTMSFDSNRWYHIVSTFDDIADEVRIYVDGVLVLTQSITATLNANTANLQIGNNWQDKPWSGLLDDVRLYDRVLSISEVSDLYASANGGGSCDGTYRDEFNAISFSGNDGTLTWTGDWQEVGETDGANKADIRVVNDISNYQLRLQDNDNGGEGVAREANFTGADSATLSLDYRREGLDSSDDYVSLEISSTGTAGPWEERVRIKGPDNDSSYQSLSYELESDEITANTAIRLRTSSSMGRVDLIYFDNIELQCSP